MKQKGKKPGEKEILAHFDVDVDRLDEAAQKLNLRMIVLFGSFARGKPVPGPESDVDIAVLGCSPGIFFECLRTLGDLFYKNQLDLVRLENADPLFRYEVMQPSILLRGDPDLYYEYRAYAYRDFTDSQDLFRLEHALFQKKMKYLKEKIYVTN